MGPSTDGASLSGAEPNEELLRNDSTEDFALKLEIDIVTILIAYWMGYVEFLFSIWISVETESPIKVYI